MPPRNRQYQTRGKGNIDLGAILLGALGGAGTGEVEPIPNVPFEGPTQAGGIIETPPQQYRVKDKSRDYTGQGQSEANRANIRAQEAREAEKAELRTTKAKIPLKVEEETALSKPLLERQKALHALANDAELQKRLNIDPLDLKKSIAQHKIDTDAELENIRTVGPEKTKQKLGEEEQLGAIRTKNEAERLKATNPLEVSKARDLARINTAAAEGIDPTERNVDMFGNVLTEPRIAAKTTAANRISAENMLGSENARRGLDIGDATERTALETARKQSRFKSIEAGQELEAQPALHEQRMQIIPRMAEQNYYNELKGRFLPTREGESLYDIAHPNRPMIKVPSKLEDFQNQQQIRAKKLSNPMGEVPPASTTPVNPDLQEIPGVGWLDKRTNKIIPYSK